MSGQVKATPSVIPPWEPATVWGWATDRDAESWDGMCATRRKVIAEAVEGTCEDDTIYIRSGSTPDPAACLPTRFVDNLIECVSENAAEWGDVAEDWPDNPTPEARAELETFVKGWLRRHFVPGFWLAHGPVEEVGAHEIILAEDGHE